MGRSRLADFSLVPLPVGAAPGGRRSGRDSPCGSSPEICMYIYIYIHLTYMVYMHLWHIIEYVYVVLYICIEERERELG